MSYVEIVRRLEERPPKVQALDCNELRKKRLREAGLCHDCGKPQAPHSSRFCQFHLDYRARKQREYYQKRKAKR